MKISKCSLYVLCCLFIQQSLLSATYISMPQNKWSNNGGQSNCGICIPQPNDDIIINQDFELSANLIVNGSLTITEQATLTVNPLQSDFQVIIGQSGKLNLHEGGHLAIQSDLLIQAGSIIEIDSGTILQIAQNIIVEEMSTQFKLYGLLFVQGNLINQHQSNITGTGHYIVEGNIINNGFLLGRQGGEDGILPIKLGEFNITRTNNGARLSWHTLDEQNFDYFIVEKSIDGTNFYNIGELKAKGAANKVTSYEFTDPNITNQKQYYRLQAIDLDGSREFFEIKSLDASYIKINAYPNPCKIGDHLQIMSSQPIKSFQICNEFGTIITSISGLINENNLSLQTTNTKSGIYFVTIRTENQSFVEKILME